jgi:amino acid transporter
MFIYTFIANISSWSYGVNEVAAYAAEDGGMPKAFAIKNSENVPVRAAIINGVVASIIVIGGIVANLISEDFGAGFSLFFCLSWITLLIGYAPMFLAFLKLRKTDPDTKRVYRVPGGPVLTALFAWVPFIILIVGVLFTLFGDFSAEFIADSIPLYVGVGLSFICQEILVAKIKK